MSRFKIEDVWHNFWPNCWRVNKFKTTIDDITQIQMSRSETSYTSHYKRFQKINSKTHLNSSEETKQTTTKQNILRAVGRPTNDKKKEKKK